MKTINIHKFPFRVISTKLTPVHDMAGYEKWFRVFLPNGTKIESRIFITAMEMYNWKSEGTLKYIVLQACIDLQRQLKIRGYLNG